MALPSYEIRCSDAGSFISKLALRFPLGTAAELLALISPSRLCDALRRRRNSLFFSAAKAQTCARNLKPLPLFCEAVFDSQSLKNECVLPPSFFFINVNYCVPVTHSSFFLLNRFYFFLFFYFLQGHQGVCELHGTTAEGQDN